MPRGTSISIRKTANARRRIARVLLRSVVTAALLPATLAAQDVESAADTTPPPPARRPARVCAGGDITLGTNLDAAWARAADRRVRQQFGITPDPMTLMTPLRQLFGDADLVLLNVETALGDGPV